MQCKLCKNKIRPFFSLGDMPLVNSFLKASQIKQEKRYDLAVAFCPKCFLVQLVETVPPKILYRDYVYFSGTSSFFLKHCNENALHFKKKLKLTEKSLVLEIASNDGSQLLSFKKLGMQVLGIDPAKNIAKVANKNGIKTIPEFFNFKFASKLKKDGIKADLVYGANVLAHVPEIVDFVKGVEVVLAPNGTAIFEFPYVKGLMENKFDTIYHEHVFYYSLAALKNLFQKADLEIYDVEQTPMQGGSLQIFVSHPGKFEISINVKKLTKKEFKDGFDKVETYQKINVNVLNLKKEIISTLKNLKRKGKKIAAYSAPAKGNILLNYFGIGRNYLDFIVDYAKAKQGLYTPGTHLLVRSLDKIYEKKLDYLLILCWNIADEVVSMKELQPFVKNGGKFLVPIPKIKQI